MSTYSFVNYRLGRQARREARSGGAAHLSLQSARLADQRITNTGGGNTSAKLTEKRPAHRQAVEVLWVKGSGGDLRTAKRENFSSLYQDKLIGAAEDSTPRAEDKGPRPRSRTRWSALPPLHFQSESARAAPSTRRCTAFVPAKHVDHTHPNAVIAIAASQELRRN